MQVAYNCLSQSTSPLLQGVQKYDDCMDIALKTKTATSVEVSWSPKNDGSAEYLVVQPLPCHFSESFQLRLVSFYH